MISKFGTSLLDYIAGTHPITKLDILASGAISSGIGAYRANKLSKKDKEKLKEQYGLGDDTNFAIRNAGRGLVGYSLGSLPGLATGFIGNNIMEKSISDKSRSGKFGLAMCLASPILQAGGAAYGVKKMTDKYSKSAIKNK